jgi:hypothetical protein
MTIVPLNLSKLVHGKSRVRHTAGSLVRSD